MKYLSIDIETTGLDPSWCQVLEVGALVDNTSDDLPEPHAPFGGLPYFHCYVVHERIVGQPYALWLNRKIIGRIAKRHDPEMCEFNFLTPDEVMDQLAEFIWTHFPSKEHKKITVAGKNFGGFDKLFLQELPESKQVLDRIHHRLLDPAPLYFEPEDQELPNLDLCLERAGVVGKVSHNAVEDAYQVIQVVRKAYEF